MSSKPSSSHSVDTQLRNSRLELLDIGLRNNLVSFRKTKKSLAAQNVDVPALLERLLESDKPIGFVAMGKERTAAAKPQDLDDVLLASMESDKEDSAQGQSAGTPPEDPPDTTPRQTKRKVPVLESALAPEPLFLQLLKMRSEAQSFVEEQGANLLFLAVGFLHWYESDTAADARRAPLVLIPCSLEREGASERFELVPTGDDIEVNLSLAAKLKTDFGIVLPLPQASARTGEDDGEELTATDWLQYLDAVDQSVKTQKRWQVVSTDVELGFFSFGKFLMFKDLDSESWPEGKKPAEHPVVRRLLGQGFGDERTAFEEDVHIDSVITPGEVHFVKDADSSQTQALLEARAGRNLVIQGPPGTGKSQTITNLIAELLGQQKSVLFVAEKMAALEVVKRRLDECNLGEAVLELHSHRATKTHVLKELASTLDLGRPIEDAGEREQAQLSAVQNELNQHCTAVASPVANSGMAFGEVLGRLLQLQRAEPGLAGLSWPDLAQWSPEEFEQAYDVIERIALVLGTLGQPKANIFWGTQRDSVTPMEENQVNQELVYCQTALTELEQAALKLSSRLHLAAPVGLHDIKVVGRAARRAAEAPRLDGIQVSTQEWQQRRDAIKALVDAGQQMQKQRSSWDSLLIEPAWMQEAMPIRQAVATYGSKWWKFLAGEWRSAKKQFQGLLRQPGKIPPTQMLVVVDSILDYQKHKQTFGEHATLGQMLFGAQWQGEASDWPVLERVGTWIVQLHDDIGQGQLPQGIIDFLAGHADAGGLGEEATTLGQQASDLQDKVRQITEKIGLPDKDNNGCAWVDLPLHALAAQLTTWTENLPQLHQMSRLNALSNELKEVGAHAMAEQIAVCTRPCTLVLQLELSWLQALVQEAYRANPLLAKFDRLEHEHRIAQFRKLDQASLRHSQAKLAHTLWKQMPRINQPGEMSVLRNELNKKRRHLPIRQLIDRAGRAIQQIKPVFMMSPMSIANFLPPGKLEFDVVIFDEASQVKAVDALGAILRGKQVIVVGDTRQMPPTDFFSRDIEQEEETSTSDIESILSMFKARGCNERYLRWHYRSRHESLIAVSNAEFYDNKLVIFPSAGVNTSATGIALEYLPQAFYDRGRTRTNKLEAQAVAQAVIEHAMRHPELTLGVAAFSVAQRDLIEVEVEMLRRHHPEAEPFFASHTHEPFFVKNLENIQGDERDIVLISIGYGRNESGKIAREFGPLNRDGGHRRLNVLITRAKLAMKIFSNFRGDELELDANAKHGVRALKNLLKYAETRELEVASETGRATDSPFEDQVIAALRDQNYAVEPQVGTAGYFIDMAVRDPDMPGRYLLAIECDGATYHSARSARDRDRLRQAVLEGLGWRFHRIWSTDWFRNPGKETERVVKAIMDAKTQIEALDAKVAQIAASRPVSVTSHATETKASVQTNTALAGIQRDTSPSKEIDTEFSTPYILVNIATQEGVELHLAPIGTLRQLVSDVVATEAPVSTAVIIRRLMTAFGVGRAGNRIVNAVEAAIAREAKAQQWLTQGDFVVKVEQASNLAGIAIRNRANLPTAERKIEWVSPLEIRAAILKAVELAFTLKREDTVSAVSQWLGFGRASSKIANAIGEQCEELIRSGRLAVTDDDFLALPEGSLTAVSD